MPVKCLGSHDGWLKVELADGTTGYSMSEYYKIVTPLHLEKPLRGGVVPEGGSLRVLPGKKEKRIAKLASGEKVTCLHGSGIWWYVRTASGDEGYMLKKRVHTRSLKRAIKRRLHGKKS